MNKGTTDAWVPAPYGAASSFMVLLTKCLQTCYYHFLPYRQGHSAASLPVLPLLQLPGQQTCHAACMHRRSCGGVRALQSSRAVRSTVTRTLVRVRGKEESPHRAKQRETEKRKRDSPCACWSPALEHRACWGSSAARTRSSTWAEKSASSPALRELRECAARSRESHRALALNTRSFLCWPQFFSSTYTFFWSPGLIIPPATMWLLTPSLPVIWETFWRLNKRWGESSQTRTTRKPHNRWVLFSSLWQTHVLTSWRSSRSSRRTDVWWRHVPFVLCVSLFFMLIYPDLHVKQTTQHMLWFFFSPDWSLLLIC